MSVRLRSADRRYFIGGSDARTIMGDDEGALLRLWQEKRGEVEPEDLSGNLIVQLGVATEALNRHWFERNTGQVLTDVQRRVQHPVVRWMAATLDGMVEATGAVFEAKFMLPRLFTQEGAGWLRLRLWMRQLNRGLSIAAWRAPRVWALEILLPLVLGQLRSTSAGFPLLWFGALVVGILVEDLQHGGGETADGLGARRQVRLSQAPFVQAL